MTANSANPVRRLWDRFARVPGGDRAFSILLGRMAPYTGSIRPVVRELGDGYSRVEMKDRRGVRNHLDSIHAIALANLAEVASGLALMYSLPAESRAILVEISIGYSKKARGVLTAECRTSLPDFSIQGEHEMTSIIRDQTGEEVARGRAHWLIGPTK